MRATSDVAKHSGVPVGSPPRVALSVVVPVYNQEAAIAENVVVIRDRISARVEGGVELVVVSDGSLDRTQERLIEAGHEGVRIIHYDRNLGKGYAIKVGVLAATGEWIAYVDADLDLDPSKLPDLLEAARFRGLDFAIGSKRHPASEVHYPRARRISSWLYQQLVSLLFQLDVRDTQVGMKVFRRQVAEEVVPLLLVKRYAFDLELLAVSRALGFTRVEELPIRLDYRFTGSGVRSLAVLRALLDTAAIFYRLRILRYYQRRKALVAIDGAARSRQRQPLVSLFGDAGLADRLAYDALQQFPPTRSPVAAARRASGDLIAFVDADGLPAGNWLDATVALLSNPDVAAVVTPAVAPAEGTTRARGAAAVRESRFGGGSQYFRYLPGNLRVVASYPGENLVARRALVAELDEDTRIDEICERLSSAGGRVIYTPEAVVVTSPPPLVRRHLRATAAHAAARARVLRRLGLKALSPTAALLVTTVFVLYLGWPALIVGGAWRDAWLAFVAAYGVAVTGAAVVGALRFRSIAVGALAVPGFLLTHVVFVAAFVRRLLGRR